jgi:hypothetical protein
MIERVPPRFATWLLERWGSRYRADSLAGDLMEQYQQGRSRVWYWKQAAVAVVIARQRAIRGSAGAATRVLARLVVETAAVLCVVVIAEQMRRNHSLSPANGSTLIPVLAALIAVAAVGFLISIRPSRRGRMRALLNALVLAFGVVALGAGTLTWADTLRGDRCAAAVCACPSSDAPR